MFPFRVKLAIDMETGKEVAIKIMRVKNMIHKRECLECLFTEINILTECRHPNVVKILDASFDGTQVKEQKIEAIHRKSSGNSHKKFKSVKSSQTGKSKSKGSKKSTLNS
jgi:serine/threonine protein kinase